MSQFKSETKQYIPFFGRNKLAHLQLILLCWLKNAPMLIMPSDIPEGDINMLKKIPIINSYIRNSINYYKINVIPNNKGLYQLINQEVFDLTVDFYNKAIKNKTAIINYYNKIFDTNKFEAYIKKEFSRQLFELAKVLHLIRLTNLKESNLLIIKNPLNRFAMDYIEKKYRIKYKVSWVLPIFNLIYLPVYFLWLFKEIVKRGFVFNTKLKTYKISVESAWNFNLKTLRDDLVIDNKRFYVKDILMVYYLQINEPTRIEAFNDAQKRGFDTAYIPKLKININNNIFSFFNFYVFIPLKVYFLLILERKIFLINYIFVFHRRCFPLEVFLNLYRININISKANVDDIATTIILNKYGTKNVVLHWTDLTAHKACDLNFLAHNVYHLWGEIFDNVCLANNFIDRKVKIGCIYKEEFNNAIKNKKDIISRIKYFKEESKTVAFFDTTFGDPYHYSEDFLIEFLEIIRDFSKANREINVLLKPKKQEGNYFNRVTNGRQTKLREVWDELIHFDNFSFLECEKWDFIEAVAISDVCVGLGMSTPATVALICGKDAFYYDNVNLPQHPFAKKYNNIIQFDDRELLLKQIRNVLKGEFKCRDVISEKEIREYDTFQDDKALDRLRNGLFEMISNSTN